MAAITTSRLPYDPKQIPGDVAALGSIYSSDLSAGEFRYLTLADFDDTGHLHCLLRPSKLNHAHQVNYTAISYACDAMEPAWYGTYDIETPGIININGTYTRVPNKVANILCMMHEKGRTLLWMDSICINQNDNDEKSIQVAQMGLIYSLAAEVISVVGQPTHLTDLAMQPKFWTNKDLYSSSYDDLFLGVDAVLSERIYWRRAWVLQEIALASKTLLCCGSYLIEYARLKELLDMLRGQRQGSLPLKYHSASGAAKQVFSWFGQQVYNSGLSKSHVRPPSLAADTRSVLKVVKNVFLDESHGRPFEIGTEKTFRGRPFLEVLKQSKQFNQCQDPRDLLYSRLALASDSVDLVSSPDYTISVEDLFRQFATNCIMTTGCLDVITRATKSTRSLPTWVPDWTARFHDWQPDIHSTDDKGALITISWNVGSLPRVSRDNQAELLAPGRVLTTVMGETSSTKRIVDKAYQSVLDVTTNYEYDESEAPRTGDLVCILQGCSLLAYLRPLEDCYLLVGRNDRWQSRILSDYVKHLLWIYKTKDHTGEDEWKWKFKDADWVAGLEQRVFRIR